MLQTSVTGHWKLETGNSKIETQCSFPVDQFEWINSTGEFPVSNSHLGFLASVNEPTIQPNESMTR